MDLDSHWDGGLCNSSTLTSFKGFNNTAVLRMGIPVVTSESINYFASRTVIMALSVPSAAIVCNPKKHLKHIAASKHWMLGNLTRVLAPCPSNGLQKLRECLSLIIFLSTRLKYVLTRDEVKKICMQGVIKIDGKVQTNINYPPSFLDVISIYKTGENFHLICDNQGPL